MNSNTGISMLITSKEMVFMMGLMLLISMDIHAQPGAAERLDSQRGAMAALSALDGEWRGTATVWNRDGSTLELTQTERVGTLLDGTVRLIEGRGYGPDGATVFHAVALLTWDPETRGYNMRSHTGGHSGDYPLQATGDGFAWELPAGPGVVRYRAKVDGATWHQTGHFHPPEGEPVRTFEMKLERIGDTGWPSAGAVGPGD